RIGRAGLVLIRGWRSAEGVDRTRSRRLVRGAARRPRYQAGLVGNAARADCFAAVAVYAAFRLTLTSAMAVSFLSAAFSSFNVCSSTLATSFRPSRLAQAMREP